VRVSNSPSLRFQCISSFCFKYMFCNQNLGTCLSQVSFLEMGLIIEIFMA
jgi:hypothetical protein